MCLIIETKKEILIPKFVMEDMFDRNNDGFGFMYIRNGHACGEKFHSDDLDELYNRYIELREFEPFIHLRMRTHGDVDQDNAHPYECGRGVWLMHNGTMNECQGEDKTKSDTWYFANEYLRPLIENSKDVNELIRSKPFKTFVTRFIGSGNRIVLADGKGTLRFNPDTWHTITNEDTKCVGMRVSNTYAWDLHRPKARSTYHYDSRDAYKGKNTIPTTTSPNRLPSHSGDPAGSFRDLKDDLWLYDASRQVWFKSFMGLIGSEEATQSPPTCPSKPESDSSKIIIVQGNEKSSEQSTDAGSPTFPGSTNDLDNAETSDPKLLPGLEASWREAYWEWLCDQFGELDYAEIYKRCKEVPDEAADFICLCLEKALNHSIIDNE